MSPVSTHGRPPVPVLFLVADTGGGHRSAAQAVAEALRRDYPGRFAPALLDPLSGPGAPWPLRRVTRLYGPLVRHAPWAWGAIYRATDSRRAVQLLQHTLLRPADRPVAEAVRRLEPGVLVSCHPLTTAAAVHAARRGAHRPRVVTVVTDLVAVHAAWPHGRADRLVVASAAARRRCLTRGADASRCAAPGLPVSAAFLRPPPGPAAHGGSGPAPGQGGRPFRVVVTGGGEGAGGIARRASALIRHFGDIEVAAICGRNRRACRRLARLAARSGGRLIVHGVTAGMAGWLGSADILVAKAGPGTIAEAACCGTPLLLTSRLPGQENGNVELAVSAGAGRYAPRLADLLREIARLRADPAGLAAMRAAAGRLARPRAATETAALIAGLAGPAPAAPLIRAGQRDDHEQTSPAAGS